MEQATRLTFAAWLLLAVSASAAGLARSEHYTAVAFAVPAGKPAIDLDAYAAAVCRESEQFRTQFCREWGLMITDGVRTAISVGFGRDAGVTLARDGDRQRWHNIWLHSDDAEQLPATLRHELVHTLLASAYTARLPKWCQEGIACREDRDELKRLRLECQTFPRLRELLSRDEITADDTAGYAAAESLVAYLLEIGDKTRLIYFARTENSQTAYGCDLAELERRWQAWRAK